MSSSSRLHGGHISASAEATAHTQTAAGSIERSPPSHQPPPPPHQHSQTTPPNTGSSNSSALALPAELGPDEGALSAPLPFPCPAIPPMDAPAATGEYSHAHELANTKASVEYTQTTSSKPRIWVDPATLPVHTHPTPVGGNAPDYVKRLNYNTVMFYGVGVEGSFGERVGRAIRFVDVSLRRSGAVECSENGGEGAEGRLEATTTAEVEVTKHMLNGAGMLHGGCVAYLIDNCCSTPLVVLGILKSVNGVGVTQSMSILFHSPAPLGTILQIVSTSIAMGGRVMSSRCEILNKKSGRIVASAFLSKMQPAKL